jgi:hypothetical protein
VEALATPDRHAMVVFCQWLLAKCVVNTQFLANIIFTDEVGCIRDGVVNFHDAHVRVGAVPTPLWH